MEHVLPYGRSTITVTGLPEDSRILLPPIASVPPIDPSQLPAVLAEKLGHPIGAPKLAELLPKHQKITIVLPDKTRKAGQAAYLPALLDWLLIRGINRDRIRLLIGLGTHPGHTQEELGALLGREIALDFAGRGDLAESSGGRSADFVELGVTSYGTPVRLHRWLTDGSLPLVTGSITYHYYAGYTGGRKGILPGCAESEAVRASHRLAFEVPGAPDIHSGSDLPQSDIVDAPGARRHPRAATGLLDGNPVYLDQVEACRFLPVAPFLLNTIVDPKGQIVDMVAGDLVAAHRYGCTLVDGYYQAVLLEPVDLVVASAGGFPSDINLIQSHKALDNAVRACKLGGTILLLAECSQGLGNERARTWAALGSARVILQRLATDYEIVGGTVEGLLRKCEGYNVRLHSALSESDARLFGFKPCSMSDGSTMVASSLLRPGQTAVVMPAAGITVPRIGNDA